MNFYKTTFLTVVSTGIKVLATLIVNKYIAVYFGPSVTTLFGNFQNFNQILLVISTAGINQGVTKYVSEFKDNNYNLNLILSTCLKLVVFSSLLVSALGVFFSDVISILIFNRIDFEWIIWCSCLTVIFGSLNLFLLSVINGLSRIHLFIKLNIIQSVILLFFSLLLMFFLSVKGAFLAIIVTQITLFLVIISEVFLRVRVLVVNDFKSNINFDTVKMIVPFAFMTITSSIVHPFTMMLIRGFLTNELSIEFAGLWSGATYISSLLLTIFSTAIATYYLPKISGEKCKKKLSIELKNGLKFAIPVCATFLLIIYTMKDLVINILFTEDYMLMSPILGWQLLGDFVKILSWFFSYFMIAKKLTKYYLISELVQYVGLGLLTFLFVNTYSFQGVSIAYFVNSMFYLLIVVCIYINWYRKA